MLFIRNYTFKDITHNNRPPRAGIHILIKRYFTSDGFKSHTTQDSKFICHLRKLSNIFTGITDMRKVTQGYIYKGKHRPCI
jgi:hypothetical protein